MFGRKKKLEASEDLELLSGDGEEQEEAGRQSLEYPEKSPLDEWEEDEEAAGAQVKRKLFGSWKKKERKEKSAKEKTPLTPAQKKKRRKRIIIGAIAAFVLVFMVLPRLFAPDVLPVVTVSEASLGTVQQVVEGSGTVQSEEVRTYFSPVSATVESFGLQVGDTVEAGETLLTYDAAELDELYRQAELTGSAAAYGYQDSIGKDNENVAEYNRSTAALEIIDRQLDEEDDNLDHLNDRVREYTGYQGDSSAKLASLKEQQAQAQAAITDLQEKQAALEAAQKALETYKASLAGASGEAGAQENTASEAENTETGAVENAGADGTGTDNESTAGSTAENEAAAAKIAELETAVAAAQDAADKAAPIAQEAQAKLPELEKSIQEEQDHYNEVILKLDEYQGRLADSQENKQKLEASKAEEEGIQSSTDASILSQAARNELAANKNLSDLNAQMTKDDINEGKEGIKAAFSGVVTNVSAVSGGPAAKGAELFTIASNEDVVVEMSITKYDLEKLQEGQTAAITLAGHEYTGTVTSLSRIAQTNAKGTPVITAEIKIDNPDENIYLGLEATVTVNGQEAKDVLVVPTECINSGQDGSFCYVVQEDGVLIKKNVETGLESDDYVEIKSGLEFGDRVVSGGITAATQEGTRVTAVEG